jgi:hypothetical protein
VQDGFQIEIGERQGCFQQSSRFLGAPADLFFGALALGDIVDRDDYL